MIPLFTKIKTTERFESNWQALNKQLQWQKGFSLILAFAEDAQAIHLLKKQLNQQFKLSSLTPQTENPLESVVQTLESLVKIESNQLIWIDLHEYSSYKSEPLKNFLSRLNERRDWLRNHLARPLILVLPDKTEVRKYAPDLWFIRDVTLYLDDIIDRKKDEKSDRKKDEESHWWQYVTDWFSGIRRRYLQQVVYEHRVFNIKGLRTRGTYNVELNKVFVELRIAPTTAPNQPHRDLLTAKELQGNQPIWEFLRYGRKRQEQLLLAIIGAPGCGKTTLLQHVALQFATQAPKGLPKWIPILLFLRQQVKTILAERPALADLVQHHFNVSKYYSNLQPPKQWLQRQLNAGNCLILLDGLDEVANAEERQQISTWIDEQTVNYPLCPFVVTSRPQGYHAAPLARATIVLEVQAFTTAQVNQFIKSWYLETEIKSFGGKDDPGIRLRAAQEAEDLQQRLQARPALQDLTVNPLLLTMIAMVHRYRGQLPGRRVELYAEICDVLLGHWREAKGIQDSLTAAQKRVALQPLAAWMMENSVREIEISKALEVMAEPLNMLGVSDGQEFLKDIQASSGLFSEREVGVWSFAHLTFQEYLAAAHYKDQKIHGNWWHRKVTDSWWQETLLLYAAQADATPIVKSCLSSQNIVALTLAADCLEEALQLDAAVRQQVETRLIANLESDDPELFKLAAEVKLQRRLRNLQRIDEKREIDRTFVSCAEYQLFLDDILGWEFHKPKSWKDFYSGDWVTSHFSKGSALNPVFGVQSNDVEAFCLWLSQKTGEKYRLPRTDEIADNLYTESDTVPPAIWTCTNDSLELFWFSDNKKRDIVEKLKKISSLPIFLGDCRQYVDNELNFSEHLRDSIIFNCVLRNKITKHIEYFLELPSVLLNKMIRFVYESDLSRSSKYTNYIMLSIALISFLLGIFSFVFYGAIIGIIIGIPISTMEIIRFYRASKHPQFQEIGVLDLKIAKYAFERVSEPFTARKNMEELLEVIYKIASGEFYKNTCGEVSKAHLDQLVTKLSKILEDAPESNLARGEFFKLVTEYLYSRYEHNNNSSSWIKRFFEKLLPQRLRDNMRKNARNRQIILQLHWWFAITTARQKGELPAWEGIRIVRESEP
jgi:hypothetical protein